MDKVAKVLSNGGVALLPTDTVYGLCASPQYPAAIAKIFALKNRPRAKNLPVLVADIAQISALGAELHGQARALLSSRFIPGALSVVLPLKNAPDWLSGRPEVAVRIPDAPDLITLLRQTGPLLATSANASGQATPANVASILTQLTGAPDIVVDDGPRVSAPSTLVDTQTTPLTVIRRGALSDDDLKEILAL